MQSSESGHVSLPLHTTRQRILIVDDLSNDASDLGDTMSNSDYDLTIVYNPFTALDIAQKWQPNVTILDVNMPGMNGLTLSERIKKVVNDPIVIFVTSDDSNEMRELCLKAGDDYLTKPYDGENLRLRVESNLRRYNRSRGVTPERGELAGGASGRQKRLSPLELRLLEALEAGDGQTVTRDALLEYVWGDSCAVNDNTLDRTIRRLREKIEHDPKHPRIILTSRCEGYRLDLVEFRLAGDEEA